MFFKKKKEIDMDNVPKHVALIMDGNGRWAKKRHLPVNSGHAMGANRVEDCLKVGREMGISHLTFYAFSTENWKRSEEEVSGIINLIHKFYKSKFKMLTENDIKFKMIGSKVGLDQELLDLFDKMEAETSHCESLVFNFAFNYGSRLEIIEAIEGIMENETTVTEEIVDKYLYTAGQPDVDLLIRTSGEQRLSNYLLWQNAYAEFIFNPIYWPEYNQDEFKKDIKLFQTRNRRFGGR